MNVLVFRFLILQVPEGVIGEEDLKLFEKGGYSISETEHSEE